MYGFRKIPHLHQGVLRSEPDAEFWNFEHSNFRRGQPDLLCLIQRKKQVAERADELLEHPNATSQHSLPPANAANLSPGQLLDINAIVNGITAIKRHQTTISAELNTLKDSNQHLWQEALSARETHKKLQDTINRILKFLAGVFGHSTSGGSSVRHDKEDDENDELGVVLPRKAQRLMIANGDREGNRTGSDITAMLNGRFERSMSPAGKWYCL
jgi:hypothetical protein